MMFSQDIDFIEITGQQGNLAIIQLQRPRALNALSPAMLDALHQQLKSWSVDNSIKAVLIRAIPGRAFCAGGDIRSVYERKLAKDPALPDYFRIEYSINSQVFHFNKPYIALLDGLTIGGGSGVSIHGSHRIVTKNMSFAMPETAIGYFPDVGASYFLSRLPFHFGFYLGLTGERIGYQDCLALGLVDTLILPEAQETLINKLAESALPNTQAVTQIIESFSIAPPESHLMQHANVVEKCFSKQTIEEILTALKDEGSAWCLKMVDILNSQSPTSLKVTLRAFQQGKQMDFDACMKMEQCLSLHFMQSHDFIEGIRAAVIDKDRKPHWEPATLALVGPKDVDYYFKN